MPFGVFFCLERMGFNMDFQKSKGFYLSRNGKNKIAFYIYRPVSCSSPRAVVQLSHGMCEFVERYEGFAEFLCKNNIILCGNDHLGHKGSVFSKSELGYFARENGDRYLTEDLHTLTKLMKKKYPDVPYFLYSHSMGSFIARDFITKYGKEIDGTVISGTCAGYSYTSVGIALCDILSLLHGDRYRSCLINALAFLTYNKKFKPSTSKFDWLTKDAEVKKWYENNDYCNFVFTASAFRDMFTLLKRVSEAQWAYTVPFDLPVLIISGDMDPLGDYGKGVKKVYKRLKSAGVNDVKLRLYKNDRHELLFETDREAVYNDVLEWINSHI